MLVKQLTVRLIKIIKHPLCKLMTVAEDACYSFLNRIEEANKA